MQSLAAWCSMGLSILIFFGLEAWRWAGRAMGQGGGRGLTAMVNGLPKK
jgi:hypothetical protein